MCLWLYTPKRNLQGQYTEYFFITHASPPSCQSIALTTVRMSGTVALQVLLHDVITTGGTCQWIILFTARQANEVDCPSAASGRKWLTKITWRRQGWLKLVVILKQCRCWPKSGFDCFYFFRMAEHHYIASWRKDHADSLLKSLMIDRRQKMALVWLSVEKTKAKNERVETCLLFMKHWRRKIFSPCHE